MLDGERGFQFLLHRWLKERGLSEYLRRVEDQEGWRCYACAKTPLTNEEKNWTVAYHGTRWYALWLLLSTGALLESDNKGNGHDFWEPGVYCTPLLETANWYGRPHVLFADAVYHQCIVELRVDLRRRKRCRARGGVQWVFPSEAFVILSHA